MAERPIELDPVDFITVGTIGPKGQRIFHLQGGKGSQLISLLIEKEQAWALSEAIREMLDELSKRGAGDDEIDLSKVDMDLREPIEPLFRVAQMGLGYDESRDMVVLVAQEMVARDAEEEESDEAPKPDPAVVRMWCSRQQMKLLCEHASEVVKAGRADPRQNGRLTYYWT